MSADLESAILDLLDARADGLTICPSEAARRAVPDDWRSTMAQAHAAALALAERGTVVLTQAGVARRPGAIKGAYRIRKA